MLHYKVDSDKEEKLINEVLKVKSKEIKERLIEEFSIRYKAELTLAVENISLSIFKYVDQTDLRTTIELKFKEKE